MRKEKGRRRRDEEEEDEEEDDDDDEEEEDDDDTIDGFLGDISIERRLRASSNNEAPLPFLIDFSR